uniref:Glucokinase 1 n=1 Tax=Trypanosoma cruzi (strain CL Brener) TaxID=353153 RepID=UPI001CEE0870|nr:Chain A, Glucokinase 1 [Trypanosoma cruzi strain CL Brener]7S2N_B Chain B, Glucokinase 1 [Trypanosoma cruzi strain CL Brener]7S2P_A Chain A, Glucokinase 1 [Trypanosoma cruzi strain CL Brener]7S2P_B Chain B, Glucokinase 1 [Trypanosoma cruzi strain CL Brener]
MGRGSHHHHHHGMAMNIKELSLHELCEELKTPAWNVPLTFVGDVGGTSARMGFVREGKNDSVHACVTRYSMKRKDITELIEFFNEIIELMPASVIKRVKAGVINVPGPVTGGAVGGPFNNLKGIARLSDYPKALFPPGRSAILNDLEAGGFGVLAVSDAHVFSEYFGVMWEGTQWRTCEQEPAGSVIGRGRCLVLAPGTGLGSSLIYYNPMNQQHIVVPLELGSQTIPMRKDIDYIQTLHAELKLLPNYENMVSGAGLEFHYRQVVRGSRPPCSAGEIAKLASEGDANACKAMKKYHEYLMRVGSEASMALLPLTIVLVGDNIVNNAFFYRNPQNLKEMHREALNHEMERLGFQSRVTYLRQKKLLNLNLMGCYRCGLDLS